jgi:hypothetical protein
MQEEAPVLLARLLVQVVDARGVEQRRAALDAVDFLSLVEQELGEVGAILFFKVPRRASEASLPVGADPSSMPGDRPGHA